MSLWLIIPPGGALRVGDIITPPTRDNLYMVVGPGLMGDGYVDLRDLTRPQQLPARNTSIKNLANFGWLCCPMEVK